MEPAVEQAFREQIEAEIGTTRERIAEFELSSKALSPDKAIGRVTRMDSFNDQGIHKAALNAAQEKLYKLEHALGRLGDPTFGLCAMCRQPIPIERLMALPESSHCVRCGQ